MNWLTRLFSPAKEPELSCFVKGLIRSMKETPEKWERSRLVYIDATRWVFSFPYICLWLPDCWNWKVHSANPLFPNLTSAEKKALTRVLFDYLEKPYHAKERDIDNAAQHGAQRKLMEPFERLGCPDQ